MADKKKSRTRVVKTAANKAIKVTETDSVEASTKLTAREKQARAMRKYATTTFGFHSRAAFDAYGTGGTAMSQYGNFYSPQLSTDFLEKPQNLRERRAWYRHFYEQNEYVGRAIDLHTMMPMSKIRLEKPKGSNQEQIDYMFDFFEEMCEEVKLFKNLLDISHEKNLLGNCVVGNTLVKTPNGYVRADSVEPGMMVLTHKGRYRRVTAVSVRDADDVLRLRVWKSGDPLDLTSEHPVEVFDNDGGFKFVNASEVASDDYVRVTWPTEVEDADTKRFVIESDSLKLAGDGYDVRVDVTRGREARAAQARRKIVEWICSLDEPVVMSRKELCKKLGIPNRYIASVLDSIEKDAGSPVRRRVGGKGFGKGSSTEWLPHSCDPSIAYNDTYSLRRSHHYSSPVEIDVDSDFLYVLGYWLGDGTLGRDHRRPSWGRGLWQITFSEESLPQMEKVLSILRRKLGDECVKSWKSKGLHIVKVSHNPAFVEWWSSQFGDTCRGENPKKIPEWVEKLPCEKQMSLLAGLVDSDGCVYSGEAHSCVRVSMVSESVIKSIRDIGFRCGVVFNYNTQTIKGGFVLPGGHIAKTTEVYNLVCYDRDSCEVVTSKSIKQFPEGAKFSESSHYWIRIGDDVAFKVRSLEKTAPSRVYNFEVEEDHTFQANWMSTHNCFIYAEEDDPYESDNEDVIGELKEKGRLESERLFKEFGVIDRDPNYRGWKRLYVLPPDQVTVKKVVLSDEPYIEFVPDTETRKAILRSQESDFVFTQDGRQPLGPKPDVPPEILDKLQDNGAIPLDTDPYTGSHVYHMCNQKSPYQTYGVSILERCVNTLLFWDKLRQAQTSIASRHMTPFRIVWSPNLSEADVNDLREQVDLALVDPDYSIIANYEIHWEEQGSDGRLMNLTAEYEQCENALFAGLGVTRELMTGESTYQGNRLTLEILNTQYLLFRETLQEYVENYLFKPVAKKKGFIEKDKYGRERLLYPRLSFTRLAIRDNDSFFDQAMQLFNKGSVSVDVILEMMNIDPISTRRKVEADLFTTNDPAFNQFMVGVYQAAGNAAVERYDVLQRIAEYLDLSEVPPQPGQEAGAGGGLGGLGGPMGRFSSAGLTPKRQAALNSVIRTLTADPSKLDMVIDKMKANPKTGGKIRKRNA